MCSAIALLVVRVLSYSAPSAPSTTLSGSLEFPPCSWLCCAILEELHYLANSMRYFFMLRLVARALEMQIRDELQNHSLPPVVLRMLSWFTIIAASWLDRQTSRRCDGLWGACVSFGAFTISFHICWHLHQQKDTLLHLCFLCKCCWCFWNSWESLAAARTGRKWQRLFKRKHLVATSLDTC